MPLARIQLHYIYQVNKNTVYLEEFKVEKSLTITFRTLIMSVASFVAENRVASRLKNGCITVQSVFKRIITVVFLCLSLKEISNRACTWQALQSRVPSP